MRRVYADHNATTPLGASARAAMQESLNGGFGNPSSVHQEGRRARDLVEAARRQVAELLGAEPFTAYFTSGGTEADALGVCGLALAARANGQPAVAAAPKTEHPAVAGALARLRGEGFDIVDLPVDGAGRVELGAIERVAREGVAVVAVAAANHELGSVNDVAAVSDICRQHGGLVHCDAVQAAGKLPIDVARLGADAVAVSAHKFYGPKGAGALWVRPGIDLEPLLPGGHQEREMRPGTENVLGIVGMGAAAADAADLALGASPDVRDRFERGLEAIADVVIQGAEGARVFNTSNVRFAGALGEVVVAGLDIAGVAVSTGAACTSGSVEPSPVLLAAGVEREHAVEAVRFSFGADTSADDVDFILEALPAIVARAREFR